MELQLQPYNMCNNNSNPGAPGQLVPFGLKIAGGASNSAVVPSVAGAAAAFSQFPPGITQAAFDYHRAQLYNYTARLAAYGLGSGYPASPASLYHPHAQDSLAHAFFYNKFDPRARFIHEEPKPSQSYIGLIAMAILGSKEQKLVLSDIYQWILDNYSYFRNRGTGWRNSIRHNLSLNDCFIKSGRSANGKGHYWAIHPANVEDFTKGDFRRRRAQRKVRKHMGLSVPDEDDSPSPSPSPTSGPSPWLRVHSSPPSSTNPMQALLAAHQLQQSTYPPAAHSLPAKKRLFDMDSLLAPDTPKDGSPSPKRLCSDISPRSAHSEYNDGDISVEDESRDIDDRVEKSSPYKNVEAGNGRCDDSPVDMTSQRQSPEPERPSSPDLVRRDSPDENGTVDTDTSMKTTDLYWRALNSSTASSSLSRDSPASSSWTPSMTPRGYPSLQYPALLTPQTAAVAAQQWQETFSKILAKSYENDLKVDVQ